MTDKTNQQREPFDQIKNEVNTLQNYVQTLAQGKPYTLNIKQFPNFQELAGSLADLSDSLRDQQKEHGIIEKSQAEWKQHSQELELLQDLSENINATHDMGQVLELMVSFIEKLLDSMGCMIFVYDRDESQPPRVSFSNLAGQYEDLLKNILESEQLEWAVSGRKTVIIPHVIHSQGKKKSGTEGSLIVAPLWVEDATIGVILILSRNPRHSFFARDLEVLGRISNAISVALQNALLYDQMQKQINDLSIMLEASKSMSSIIELDELLKVILSLITQVASWKAGILLLFDEEAHQLEPSNYTGIDPDIINHFYLSLGQGITGTVAENRSPIFINSEKQKKYFKKAFEFDVLGAGALFSIPLENKNRLLGVLNLYHDNEKHYLSESDQEMILSLVQHASITLDNVLLYKATEEQAKLDELTRLYNVRFLKEHLEEQISLCKKKKRELSLVVIDLDEFQKLNDEHGHQMGSWALKEVSQILSFMSGKHDFVARHGGGEFIIVRSGIPLEKSFKLARRIQKSINSYSFLKDHNLAYKLSASIAVGGYPDSGKDAATLLEKSRTFLYQTTDEGKKSSNEIVILE